jgi:hypothetical protein
MQQGVPNFTIILHEPRVTRLSWQKLHVSSAQVYSVIEATIFMILKRSTMCSYMLHGRITRTSLAHTN